MLKKMGMFILIFTTLAYITGCTARKVVEIPSTDGEIVDSNPGHNVDYIVDPEPEGEEVKITLYYANLEYIMTGDESLDKIIPVEKYVTVGERSIEEIVVSELQIMPEDENLLTELKNLKVLSVDTAEGIAYVNLSSEQLSGSSLQETLVLQQLVYSLTELDGVEAVQVLVDGSKVESLMGHITIEEPLTR